MDTQSQNLIHSFETKKTQISSSQGLPYLKFFSYLGLAVVVGVGAGLLFAKVLGHSNSSSSSQPGSQQVQQTAGIVDKKTFKDSAEGILKNGGIDGEGSFHLERPGGASQNVYLTSSTVDLSKYVGKKVKVWGETFQAQKAGWLMDVGLVEVQ